MPITVKLFAASALTLGLTILGGITMMGLMSAGVIVYQPPPPLLWGGLGLTIVLLLAAFVSMILEIWG